MFGTVVAGSLDARADSGNPFGFETNKHPLEYEFCKKEPDLYREHGYRCSSAPRPHPDLEVYNLQFVEDVGLCLIGAYMVTALPFGDIVDKLKSQIAQKYGPPTGKGSESFISNTKYSWLPTAGFNGLGEVIGITIRAASDESIGWIEVRVWLVPTHLCENKIDDKAERAF